MRFMMIIKADKDTEAGVLPDEKSFLAMTKYNEDLVNAGVLLAGEGLHPSSKGVRVRFEGGKPTVIDGPFSETKELVAGFWLIQVRSKEEAVEWAKRVPCGPELSGGGYAEIELRQVAEMEDLGEAFTPELQEKERQLRERVNAAKG
ncbi:YciI family protein [Chondromyces apiculatus]|uniref:PhnB protein n=1 Tax=Chondromyces apiculatus DSM 436 TaxID=1192034 RepID=A0A017TIG5_9BACT|nr:YciI family protein [Chondromyces apiculatus]EYF08426.1 PhnB protein [Chondromyces apiculatus DSM 436]